MGPGVANECVETKDGLHIWEDHFYPEIINPDTGEPVADGEMGELVFTTLTKEGMPIIRYRTRDLTRLLPGTARSMRRMEKVTGRSDDMIILRGVNVFPTQIEEQIMRIDGLSPHFQIELVKKGALDAMRVHVEPEPSHIEHQAALAAAQLESLIKDVVGVTAHVITNEPRERCAVRRQSQARRRQSKVGTQVARTIAKDYSEKRQAILQSSAELFAAEGYGRATMSQIAQACGVSKANIYHYYDSKEALLYDILETHLRDLRDTICGLTFTSTEPRNQLLEITTELLLSYQGSDASHKVQINAISVLPPDQQRILRGYQKELVTFVQNRIAAIVGMPKNQDPAYLRDITMSLFAMVNWHFLWDGSADETRRRTYAARICALIDGAH